MSDTLEETAIWPIAGELAETIPLELTVSDHDTIWALAKYGAGPERDEFALEALKIGVLALRHASGALDSDFIQRETTRLVDTLRQQLDQHASRAQDRLTGSLKDTLIPRGDALTSACSVWLLMTAILPGYCVDPLMVTIHSSPKRFWPRW